MSESLSPAASDAQDGASAEALIERSVQAHQAGAFEAALAAAEEAIGLAPENALVWKLKAMALFKLERPEEALAAMRRATELAPEDADAWQALGSLLQALGRHGEAVGALKKATDLDPGLAEAWLQQAQSLNASAQYEGALATLQRAGELDPESLSNARFLFARAVALNSLSRQQEALDDLEKMVELDPELLGNGYVWLQKGIALNRLLRPVEGFEALAQAATLLPKGADRGAALLQQGVTLTGLGRPEEALKVLEAAAAAIPDGAVRGSIELARGLAATGLHRHDAALAAFEQALTLLPEGPDRAVALLQRTNALFSLGRHQEALAALEEIERSSPARADHPFHLLLKGNVLMFLDRLAEGRALHERAAEPGAGHESDAEAWLGVALARDALARSQAALDALAQVARLSPSLERAPLVQQTRVSALTSLERYDEALAALEGAAPDLETTWLFRGIALAGLAERQPALEAFDRTVELAAQSAGTYHTYAAAALTRKGQVLVQMESPAEALAAFDAALAHSEHLNADDPSRMVARMGKALALSRQDKREEALQASDEATQLSAGLPANFPHRGVAWWAKGELLASFERYDEALLAYGRAAGLEPDNVDVLLSKGHALLRLEDYGQAHQVFQQAAERAAAPGDKYIALVGMGQALGQRDQTEKAIALFRDAIGLAAEIEHNPWRAWASLGAAYTVLGRPEVALRAFLQGWERDRRPKRASALALGVGAALLDLKRDQEALDFLTDARGKAEPDPRIDYNLGLALHRLNEVDKAKAAWQEAAAKGLPQAAEHLRLLEKKPPATGAWIDFWFGASAGWHRRAFGALLLLLLGVIAALPIIRPYALPGLSWLNTGQDWTVIAAPLIVLAALLLAPTLGRLSVGGVEVELTPSRPEAPSAPGPNPDAVLSGLGAIRVTVLPG